jgi:hypothetical protein
MSGKPSSSIGFERRWNPMLKLERSAFVDALEDVPPKPVDMGRIMRRNQGRGGDVPA